MIEPTHGPVPRTLNTARLRLRPWHPDDAARLLPILEANRAHLLPWIPARVAEPAPLPELAERLARFAANFDHAREWRYGLFSAEDGDVLGEVGLFPRSPEQRVPFGNAADRAEIGYWLRADVTGRGMATEAARAMLELAARIPTFTLVEIRCDAHNAASAAIPQRLGFVLQPCSPDPAPTHAPPDTNLQVWTRTLVHAGAPR